MQALRWKPPSRPDHPAYQEILALVEEEKKRDPIRAMAWFAAVAESDFWFWQKQVMSLGGLKIQDKHHKRKGSLVVDEPWFFDRMREVQDDFDNGRSDILYQWFRGSFKTTAIVKGGAIWFLAKNHTANCQCGACPPPDTIAIFTHKVEQVGESMGADLLNEIENNAVLRAHWPQFRNLKKASATLIIVDRKEGPKEPSISVHPILGSAASGHYTKIFVDDAVTDRIARSPEDCKKVGEQLSYLQPLGRDDTQYFFVSTPYGEMDPVHKKSLTKGFFSRVSKQPAILRGNIPQLFSLKFFQDKQRKMEDWIFQSQYMLRIIPKGDVYFREGWLRRYTGRPQDAARGCRIRIIVDMAGGGEGADFTIVRVIGFTFDKKRRNLDLWRERIGLTDTADLLFGVMPGDEELPENWWKPKGGLVRQWQRLDKQVDIHVEEIGASGHAETFRREMKHRKKHDPDAAACQVYELRSQRKKENRIAKLQPAYRNGVVEYPQDGFGHGSFTTEDDRDTLVQFVEDEYKLWTMAGETENDDMLDSEAWPEQPEVVMSYPSALELDQGADGVFGFNPHASRSGGEVSWAQASWRVA